MGIEAGRKQDRVGAIVIDDPHDVILDRAQVSRVAGAFRKGNVLRESAAFVEADLVRRAGPWIERVAMHRRVVHIVAIFEQMLRAIAVMHIEVEDEDAIDSVLLAQPVGNASDGVEKTEAHRLDALRMVAGWAGDHERALLRLEHVVRGAQRGGNCSARGGEGLR